MPAVKFYHDKDVVLPELKPTLENPVAGYSIHEDIRLWPEQMPLVYDASVYERDCIPYFSNRRFVSIDFRYILGFPKILNTPYPIDTPQTEFLHLRGLSYYDSGGQNIFFYNIRDTRKLDSDTPLKGEYFHRTFYILNLFSILNAPFDIVLQFNNENMVLKYFSIYPFKTWDIDKDEEIVDNNLSDYLQWIENTVGSYEGSEI